MASLSDQLNDVSVSKKSIALEVNNFLRLSRNSYSRISRRRIVEPLDNPFLKDKNSVISGEMNVLRDKKARRKTFFWL